MLQQVEVDSRLFEATIVGWWDGINYNSGIKYNSGLVLLKEEQLMQLRYRLVEAKQRPFREYMGGSNLEQEERGRIIPTSQKITT